MSYSSQPGVDGPPSRPLPDSPTGYRRSWPVSFVCLSASVGIRPRSVNFWDLWKLIWGPGAVVGKFSLQLRLSLSGVLVGSPNNIINGSSWRGGGRSYGNCYYPDPGVLRGETTRSPGLGIQLRILGGSRGGGAGDEETVLEFAQDNVISRCWK